MTHELEKIKAYILEQTEGMAENAKIELLDALAWWASEEAGSLNLESPDAEDYDSFIKKFICTVPESILSVPCRRSPWRRRWYPVPGPVR